MRVLLRIVVACLALAPASTAHAQWLNHPTPGIPRTASGAPDLSAPAPRTPDGKPDLSGVWGMDGGPYTFFIGGGLKPGEAKPFVAELLKERDETLGRDDQQARCLPEGPRFNHFLALPRKIVQTPTLIVVLSEDLSFRQIFLDGRPLPQNPSPSFMGYSVGRWEGDTLVVESIGYKDTTWLDFAGHPHSEALHLTERYRRTSFGQMEIEETFEDKDIYSRPLQARVRATLVPDTDLLEYVCNENERDRPRLIGRMSEVMKGFTPAKVAPAVLAQYVGTYDWRYPENPTIPSLMPVALEGDTLTLGGAPLVPISQTKFMWGSNPLEFVKDANGRVTHFVSVWVEGDLVARRIADGR